jgi:hypothetical protein
MNMLLDKIGEGGCFGSLFGSSLVPLCSFEYVQNFRITLIGSDFKKKHLELHFYLS